MKDLYRPYASPDAFLRLLDKTKFLTLPQHLNSRSLLRDGHSQVTSSRLLGAMQFFSLTDESGKTTPEFGRIAKLDDQGFREALKNMIQVSYKDIFDNANPSSSTKEQIEEAFRGNEPASQHYRMMVFFLGLCRQANISVFASRRSRQAGPENRNRRGAGGASSAVEPPALSNLMIRGLMLRLPKEGTSVSVERKDHWLDTMRHIFDEIYPDSEEKIEKT